MSRVALLDATNLAYRCYHAAKHAMSDADGAETGTLHLFATGLSRYLNDPRPDRFVACWDCGGSTFRETLYPQYKSARRATQAAAAVHTDTHHVDFALVREFLALCGLAQWSQSGVEADDLIAAAWKRQRAAGDSVLILSSDKDLIQLLDEGTRLLRFSSYGTPTDMWTRDRMMTEFGYTPEQVPLMMALTGDASDSVPGLRGVGPQRAKKMLTKHDWDFEKLCGALDAADAELARVSRELVDLSIGLAEVPEVPEYAPLTLLSPVTDWERVADFCAQHQLRVLFDRLSEGALW